MKRYIAIAILGLALLAGNIWHGAVKAQTRTDKFQGNVVVRGTSLSVNNATDPALVSMDSTNTVTTKVQSRDSQGFIGTTSNHDLRIMTNSTVEMTILAAGNVGIGTITPTGLLHVVGPNGLFLIGTSKADDTRKYGWFGTEHYDIDEEPFIAMSPDSDTSINRLRVGGGVTGGNAATEISFYTAANTTTTTGTERMTILAAGNVGIGTTTPGGALHVNAPTPLFLFGNNETDDTSKYAWMAVEHYDVDEEPFFFFAPIVAATTNIARIGGGSASGNAATSIAFYTAANSTTVTGTERVIINSAGKVGIGTSSPAVGLHGVVTNGTLLWAGTEADNANKYGRWGVENYDVDEEPFYGIQHVAETAANTLRLGGGYASGNAATAIQFYTAANNTTTTGTERARINSQGQLLLPIGTAALPTIGSLTNADLGIYFGPNQILFTVDEAIVGDFSSVAFTLGTGIRLSLASEFARWVERGAAPTAPPANQVDVYAIDNGGKTELCARFNSGAACVQIAIEP